MVLVGLSMDTEVEFRGIGNTEARRAQREKIVNPQGTQ